jgi:hypothetical protein
MSRSKSLKTAMMLMVAAAIFAPAAATAKPIDAPLPEVKAVTAQAQVPSNLPLGVLRATEGVNSESGTGALERPAVAGIDGVDTSDNGFGWGDAAIGAAVMLTLLSLAAGVVLIGRRSRGRGQTAAAS